MDVSPAWQRICGIHQMENGEIAAVWLARDPNTDIVHVYDSCMFRGDDRNPIIVAEGLNARGRWIPIAHDSAELADNLLNRGCNMEKDACKDTKADIEVISNEIDARMRTGRFKVEKRLGDWIDERKTFFREDAKVPTGSYPLMTATRHAMSKLEFALAQTKRSSSGPVYQKVAMV
jgi:hypothetical protein